MGWLNLLVLAYTIGIVIYRRDIMSDLSTAQNLIERLQHRLRASIVGEMQ